MPDPLVEVIRREIEDLGTLKAVAQRRGFSSGFLCQVLRGRKPVTARVRRSFLHDGQPQNTRTIVVIDGRRYRRVVTYERVR